MTKEPIEGLIAILHEAIIKNEFVKLILSKPFKKGDELKRLTIKPVSLKNGLKISFQYQYQTRDEVKNHSVEATPELVLELMRTQFLEANLFTISHHHSLLMNLKGNGKLLTKPVFGEIKQDFQHDKQKKRLVQASGLHWHLLGMTDQQGQVIPSMQHKFKQINKYVEILDGLISPWAKDGPISVVDMGAGKGYLTFALYEHLTHKKELQPTVIGVEMRPDLIQKTNSIAEKAGLSGLVFSEGSIENFKMPKTDILIALHACDTATDDAIAAGIAAGVQLIVCAPCCHKQIRREMQAAAKDIPVLKYGILFERQAEIITDTLRALIMEKYGYQSHIQEFIEAEHTPKNVLLSGYRTNKPINTDLIDQKIAQLKADFGIKEHFLEKALQLKRVKIPDSI